VSSPRLAGLCAAFLVASTAATAADLTIQDTKAAGFSDTTPAPPLGLNPGTTRGDQSLIVFQTAAAMWGATVRSTIPIVINSEFVSSTLNAEFDCTSQGTVLAFTQPAGYLMSSGFPVPQANYDIPLANALTGRNNLPDPTAEQFTVNINADLGTSLCDFPASWYFGLDTQIPNDGISLLTTLLHEFGHGLGFSSLINPSSGSGGLTIWDFHIWDVIDNISLPNVSPGRVKNLITTTKSLAFQGPAVQADVPVFLGVQTFLATTFNGATTELNFAEGDFSGPLEGSGALAATSPTDACSDLSNPTDIHGKFALVERSIPDAGNACTFYSKAQRAVDAGALGIVVYDSVVGESLVQMSGSPPLDIPAVFISNTDGTTLQTELGQGPVSVDFAPGTQLSNAGPNNIGVLLYTPSTLSPGSSLIHWNAFTSPQTLMLEFANQPDIRLNMDFTPDVMSDLGWSVVSGLGVTVVKLLDPSVPAGGQVQYLIAIMNRRATPIDSVGVNLALPSGTTFVSNASSPAGCETAFPCTLPSVPGRSVVLIVTTVQAPDAAADPFDATVTLTPSSSDPGDSLTSTISSPVAGGGDLQVTVSGPSSLTAGGTATLTTTITNLGPGDAAGVMLNGVIGGTAANPPAFSANAGSCAGAFPCAFGTLTKGQAVTINTTYTLPSTYVSGSTYTATATSTTPDSNAANNTASFTFAQGTGSSGCSSTGEPVTVLGVLGLALVLLLRKRVTF
jgi:uncharacterized protein (TIGR03382 family)/uncharacterized repeat protein (TIGR01451 family)